MNPFTMLIGPMYAALMFIIKWFVVGVYAVTDQFAMVSDDGARQAVAFYAVPQQQDQSVDVAGHVRADQLIVRLPSGQMFTTVDPQELLSGNEPAPAAASATSRTFALRDEAGSTMRCSVTRDEASGEISSAGCLTDDGVAFELRT